MTKSRVVALILCFAAAGGLPTACGSSSPTEAPATASATTESPVPTQVQSPIPTVESDASSVGTPVKIPTPEQGKASVGGTLFTFSGHAPIPGTIFYLIPSEGASNGPPRVLSGPNAEHGDIQGQSDSSGHFAIGDIAPGSYYLAVWAPYDWILAVESPSDQTPRLITLEPNQCSDLGRVDVAWP